MEFTGKVYENKSMTEKTAREQEFTDCVFKNCKFRETQFVLCRFEGCTFEKCAFVNVKFSHSLMFSSSFQGCSFVNFSFAPLSRGYGAAKLTAPFSKATGCFFKYVSFAGFDLEKDEFFFLRLFGKRF